MLHAFNSAWQSRVVFTFFNSDMFTTVPVLIRHVSYCGDGGASISINTFCSFCLLVAIGDLCTAILKLKEAAGCFYPWITISYLLIQLGYKDGSMNQLVKLSGKVKVTF